MSFTTDPWLWPPGQDVPPTRCAVPIAVYRWHAPVDGGDGSFDLLDNVICLEIVSKLAPDPGHCVLQYLFGTGDPLAPADATEAVNSAITKLKTIEPNDRIVVKGLHADGVKTECIFDGFALAWSVVMDAGREAVQITCVGVARRASDRPIRGALYRQGNAPESIDPADQVATDLTAHFNPKGIGNCPLVGRLNIPPNDVTGGHYPFIDPSNSVLRALQPTQPGQWPLYEAVRYLCFYENKDHKYVDNPVGALIDLTLVAYVPVYDALGTTGIPFDPTDPTTYFVQDISAPDKPVSGKDWPATIHDLIAPHGFIMTWDLSTGDDGTPSTGLRITHPQRTAPKSLWLQPRGSSYDPVLTNLGGAEITRDLDAAVNRWEVHGEQEEWEASFVLAQNFPASEVDDFSIYDLANVDTIGWTFWREFILDECGEGHYLPGSADLVSGTPADLDKMLGAPIETLSGLIPQYVARRRPPIGDLVTTSGGLIDGLIGVGRPLRWSVAISKDYGTDAAARFTTLEHETPTGGFWQIIMAFAPDASDGYITAGILWNCTAADVQAAVEALPNVGAGNAIATGGPFPGTDIIVRLTGDRAATPITTFTVGASELTGPAGTAPAVTRAAFIQGKNSPVPGLWDGSGTWQDVTKGGFALMHDRVGVRYTGHNPNAMDIGKSDAEGAPFPNGKVNLIECLGNPDDPVAKSHAHPLVWIRLTCVVRGDKRLKATIGDNPDERLDSPLGPEVVTRVVDAHDRYKTQTVYAPSKYNIGGNTNAAGNGQIWRDDSDLAKSEAIQMQVTTLNGLLQGPVTIPRFTRTYLPGDRIDQINGRSIAFRADDGSGARAAAWLPIVTEVRWQFSATGQRTLISLSDADAGRGTVLRGRGIYRRGQRPGAVSGRPAGVGGGGSLGNR